MILITERYASVTIQVIRYYWEQFVIRLDKKTLTLREFFAYSVQYYDTVPPNENTFFGMFVDHDISLLNQKLFIFVFKPETLRNFTPEQLVERDYCDGKFFLNCADLDRANYSFSYNGE